MKKSILDTLIKELRNEEEDIPKGWMNAAQIAKICDRDSRSVAMALQRKTLETKVFRVKASNGCLRPTRFYHVA